MSEEQDKTIDSLLARQKRLERELAESRRELLKAIEKQQQALDLLDQRLGHIQSRASVAYQEVRSILNSRIWRALTRGGALALQASRLARGLWRHKPGRASGSLQLHCEEPADEGPYTGMIRVSGWAVSPSGIERVEVRAGALQSITARSGLYRPDVARQFPWAQDGDRSGFLAACDTLALPNGCHTITVRAIDRSGRTAETAITVQIDHRNATVDGYAQWITDFETRDAEYIRLKLASLTYKPLISVLVPVYRTRPRFLERAIQSVRAQSYSEWELCLVDDHSVSEEINRILQNAAAADPRIRYAQLPENRGISAASNLALEMARGDFIALLDHDDELAEDALFFLAEAANDEPEADIIYSDEDHIDDDGRRSAPFFKPDWSPNTILSENYVTHLMAIRRQLAVSIGGFRAAADLSQDHDILLRASLKARKIVHIPRILYHWRTNLWVHDSTRASDTTTMAKVAQSQREAIENYLREAGIDATVEPGRHPDRWRVRYRMREWPRVTAIIPCGGNMKMLTRCIDSLLRLTDYPHCEFLVIDNSRSNEVEQWVAALARENRPVRRMDWRNRRFNYAAMNNDAVAACDSPLVLFLNDDVAAIEPEWLKSMVELTARPEVAGVGARLLYPDGRIQHAGLVVGIFGTGGHAFKGCFGDERVYFDFPDIIRDVSALTAACLLMRSAVFREVGGFDAEHFPVAYNDLDLCLKVRRTGRQLVYTPHATLFHYEAVSKAPEDMDPRPEETAAFREKWRDVIARDPFYNPNLTQDAEDFSLRKKRR